MRTVCKNIRFGKSFTKMYYEQFQNYDEYWKIVEEREKTNAHDKDSDLKHICSNSSWVGCKSYEEAKDLLVNGWDSKLDYFKRCVEKETDLLSDTNVVRTFTDVAGFMPIVPNAIMGLPNCMINMRQEKRKSRIIKFLIAMNRSARYGSNDIIEKMSKVLARIAVLERHGYRCRIELFGSFHDGYESDKTIACHSVLLKSENQLFNLRRMAFPIAHSAMQRVFGFAWENSLPINYYSYHFCGLGRSVQYWSQDKREALLEAINENHEKLILIGMESDLEEVFGKGVKLND